MNRIIQFALFITVFLAIYIGLNSYAVFRLSKLLGLENKYLIYGLILLVTLAIPGSMMIEKFLPNIITRIVYTASTLWMGVLLFLFSSLIIYEILKLFIKINPRITGFVILAVVVLLSVISVINAFFVHVNEVEVPIDGLKQDMTVVQLSDIHIGTIRNSGFLKKLAEKTNDLNPDIVMITGDLVDGSAPLHKSMFSPFDKIKAPIFFVTGNHETYEGVDKVFELLNETSIKALTNQAVQFDGIQVVGINFSTGKEELSKELDRMKLNSSKPAILMYHAPVGMEYAKAAGIDLQLSGHTHNGQIFPFNYVVKLVLPYIKGLYDFNGMHLYVSPGTGTWGPYMRLGSRNEITLLKLKKK